MAALNLILLVNTNGIRSHAEFGEVDPEPILQIDHEAEQGPV